MIPIIPTPTGRRTPTLADIVSTRGASIDAVTIAVDSIVSPPK